MPLLTSTSRLGRGGAFRNYATAVFGPAASYETATFGDGSEFAGSGDADYLPLSLPHGASDPDGLHIFWASIGTAVQPTVVGATAYHTVTITAGMNAAEVTAAYAQAVVNTGFWSVPGYAVMADPVLWQSQLISNNPAFFSGAATTCQKIKGIQTGSITVTKVNLDINSVFASGDITLKLTANADGSGTLYGTSGTLTVSSSGVKSFTFSGATIPTLTDFYISVQNSGGSFLIGTGYNGSFVEPYLTGQGYDALIEGTSNIGGINPSDLYFAVYAIV